MINQEPKTAYNTRTIVDVHTHVYPPSYMNILRSRSAVPYVREFSPDPTSRLIILPGEDSPDAPTTARGRPIGPEYYDISTKISFMDKHGIHVSVISLANPWLDFIPPSEAAQRAKEVNDEINEMCERYPGRLFAFGALPLSGTIAEIVCEVKRLKGLKYMRGVVMGTGGLGKGLDDLRLEEVYKALDQEEMVMFLHPHYGLPKEVFGERNSEYGHVLPLALGFPLETTIAITRMILSGVFDRYINMQVLLAHSGGTLPFLAGRIDSCIVHDGHIMKQKEPKRANKRNIWEILRKNILLDAVVYSEIGLRAAMEASGGDRVMFGTDHPFFPPLTEEGKIDQDAEWLSVRTNYNAVDKAFGAGDVGNLEGVADILGMNAVKILRLSDV